MGRSNVEIKWDKFIKNLSKQMDIENKLKIYTRSHKFFGGHVIVYDPKMNKQPEVVFDGVAKPIVEQKSTSKRLKLSARKKRKATRIFNNKQPYMGSTNKYVALWSIE